MGIEAQCLARVAVLELDLALEAAINAVVADQLEASVALAAP